MNSSNKSKRHFDAAANGGLWDEWNREWRFRDRPDGFMRRQLAIAVDLARRERLSGARILGIGCGTGWLENGLTEFGEVWGTDLSAAAIREGERRHPNVKLLCCDFLDVDLPAPFDMIVSADSLLPMADHRACIERVAGLLRPGGTFLLMTQNPFVWRRRSKHRLLPDVVPHARLDEWPGLGRIHELLRDRFAIEASTTIDPGGDTGLLWWVENPTVRSIVGRLIGDYRWIRALEFAGLGRELVLIARKR